MCALGSFGEVKLNVSENRSTYKLWSRRNALSFSDGPRNYSTGRLLFYLTTMDATAFDVEVKLAMHMSCRCCFVLVLRNRRIPRICVSEFISLNS